MDADIMRSVETLKTLEGVKKCLANIGYISPDSPEISAVPSLKTLSAHAAKQILSHENEAKLSQDLKEVVVQVMHVPLLQENALSLHKIFGNSCSKKQSLPFMPHAKIDRAGKYMLAYKEGKYVLPGEDAEFFLYELSGSGADLLLHKTGAFMIASDFSFLLFNENSEIFKFDVSKRTTESTGVMRDAFERQLNNEYKYLLLIDSKGSVLLQEVQAEKQKESLDGKKLNDPYFFVAEGNKKLKDRTFRFPAPPQWYPNGYRASEIQWITHTHNITVPLLFLHCEVPISTKQSNYSEVIRCIVENWICNPEKGGLGSACISSQNGRFFLGSIEKRIMRVDLEKLDAPEGLIYGPPLEFDWIEKLAISDDGAFCLALMCSRKTDERWYALPENKRPPQSSFMRSVLILLEITTGRYLSISKRSAIITFGFIRSADCFFVWEAPDNFMIYDLRNISSLLSCSQLTKLVTLERSLRCNGNTLADHGAKLLYDQCLESIGCVATNLTGALEVNDQHTNLPIEDIARIPLISGEKERFVHACDFLNLGDDASVDEIKAAYSSIKEQWHNASETWFSKKRASWIDVNISPYVKQYARYAKEKCEGFAHDRIKLHRKLKEIDTWHTKGLEQRLSILEAAYKAMLIKRKQLEGEQLEKKDLVREATNVIKDALQNWLFLLSQQPKPDETEKTTPISRNPLLAFPQALTAIKKGFTPEPHHFLEISEDAPRETINNAWKSQKEALLAKIAAEPEIKQYGTALLDLLDAAHQMAITNIEAIERMRDFKMKALTLEMNIGLP